MDARSLSPVLSGQDHSSRDGGIVNAAERVTSELLWRGALIVGLIDVAVLFVVGRWVSPALFRQLKWYLAAAAFFVYAALWGTLASVYFWETVYQAVFPSWSRWLLPWGFGLLYGALAVGFWRLSAAAARWPAVWFSLCGGFVSLVGHGIGIRRGLLQVPLLSEAGAASALVFGVFEFVFYWCAILGLAVAGRRLGASVRHPQG
jgi:hypothetical protein